MATDLVAEKPRTMDDWGICGGCGKERRTDVGGIVAPHGSWVAAAGEMVYPCPGTGQAVMRRTT
jgi:hypothetical protein